MSEKLQLSEVLAAIDIGAKDLWDNLSDDERKQLKSQFFTLNRYISAIDSTNRELQEQAVLTTNEYFNKHWASLQHHPQLLWQLASLCGNEHKQIKRHTWIKLEKTTTKNKVHEFLIDIYPDMKHDDLFVLSKLASKDEILQLAEEHGYTKQYIKTLYK